MNKGIDEHCSGKHTTHNATDFDDKMQKRLIGDFHENGNGRQIKSEENGRDHVGPQVSRSRSELVDLVAPAFHVFVVCGDDVEHVLVDNSEFFVVLELDLLSAVQRTQEPTRELPIVSKTRGEWNRQQLEQYE